MGKNSGCVGVMNLMRLRLRRGQVLPFPDTEPCTVLMNLLQNALTPAPWRRRAVSRFSGACNSYVFCREAAVSFHWFFSASP